MGLLQILVVFVFVLVGVSAESSPFSANVTGLPTVLWHGMGDTCCYSFSMGRISKLITNYTNNYVHSIMVGSSIESDEYNGFFMNINSQVDEVCAQLKADPKLANGFNAVGFSQGSQFLRAYVQRCNSPPVVNLVTLGGQHQGVFGFPKCPGANATLCEIARELIDLGVYDSFVQNHLVQAEYWQDPWNLKEFYTYNIFLPDINNMLPKKNQTYVTNLVSLKNFVMVMFLQDTMVQPKESAWFAFYAAGQDKTVVPLRQSELYNQDWLGLKQMDAQGKLTFLSVKGDHLQFSDAWFVANVIHPYLL
jgi:palmitoyl-protein thioesterase